MDFPVFGLFRSRDRGQKALDALHASGYSSARLSDLTDDDLRRLPSDPLENRRSMTRTYLGASLGIAVGIAFGFSIGFLLGTVWAFGLAAFFGAIGAVAGLALSDSNKQIYKTYRDRGGVLLRVEPSQPAQNADRAIAIMHEKGATEVSGVTPAGAPEDGS